MKKDQNLPNKNVYSNNSSGKPLPSNQNYSRNQSPYNSSYRGRSPEQRNSPNFSQNRYSRSNSRNNYPRSNSNSTQFVQHPVPTQTEIDTIQIINHEIHLTIEIETIQIIGTETTQTIEIEAIRTIVIILIQTIDHKIIHTTDQTIKDQITIKTIDREITHKIEIPVTIIDIEITPNHLKGVIIAITILSTDIEAIHRNTKNKLFKYKQIKK